MITRPKYPKQKTVMVINDMPVKNEIDTGDIFSSVSNLNLLTSLRTGKLYQYGKERAEQDYKGIKASDIYPTYLSTFQFEKDNYDWKTDIVKGKDRLHNLTYHKLEHQKDVWVSERLWNEFTDLLTEIDKVQPKLIIVTGKWSLFFLVGCTSLVINQGKLSDKKMFGGLSKYRSSILQPYAGYNLHDLIIVPVWHTVNLMAVPDKSYIFKLDIEKLGWIYHIICEKGVNYYKEPERNFIVGDTKDKIVDYLTKLKLRLDKEVRKVSIDIETMFYSVIDCIGIADSITEGLCIPFATNGNANFYSLSDETEILCLLKEVLEHENCHHVGQNYAYDAQYMYKVCGITVNAKWDTMVMHHVLFNYMQKDLAFLASLYCTHYTYWKGEITALKESPETRMVYNIKDVCFTLEIQEVLEEMLLNSPKKMFEFYKFQQEDISPALVSMMNKGVKVDLQKKEELHTKLTALLVKIELKVNDLLGEEVNLKSSKQIGKVFTDLLQVKPVLSKLTKSASFGSDAMLIYLTQYPLYKPLITLILEYRSIGVFVRTFLSAQVDEDGRMRTSYGVAGTKSYRLSSRKNAFGKGMNCANIPSKGKIDLKYSLIEDEDNEDIEGYTVPLHESITKLPNCKALFLPDEGYNFFNIDYSGADAMVVAWDSDCAWLQNFFNTSKEKLYIYVAREYLQRDVTTSDPFYKKIKQFIHLINYGGMEEKAAASSGLALKEARELRQWYFSLCPEILAWHSRIANDVRTKGYIENIFGARFWLLDKNCPTLLNQAYALIPQSTIAILVNKGLVNIHRKEENVDVLLQIHDAVAGQYLKTDIEAPDRIKKHMEIILPYPKPLIIPADIGTSELNYGDCD